MNAFSYKFRMINHIMHSTYSTKTIIFYFEKIKIDHSRHVLSNIISILNTLFIGQVFWINRKRYGVGSMVCHSYLYYEVIDLSLSIISKIPNYCNIKKNSFNFISKMLSELIRIMIYNPIDVASGMMWLIKKSLFISFWLKFGINFSVV